MDPGAILHELTQAEGLPREALTAASEQRVEMLPIFLGEIEGYLALEPGERAKPTPLFFIFHLLGEWREKSAYRPLARFLRCPTHELDVILGDAITSTAHRVMAAIFDGDPEPLYEIILDCEADQFIRSRMCETLAMVTLRGDLDRAIAGRFLRDAFMELRPQAESFVWFGWQSAIAMLGLSELKVLVKRACDRGFIDPQTLRFEHFEKDLRRAMKGPDELERPDDDEFSLFGNTVKELSAWYGFSEKYRADRERAAIELDDLVDQPYQNPFRGVGRNDPCPCGSGKKFKNCCLRR